jgi:hypothetical protein
MSAKFIHPPSESLMLKGPAEKSPLVLRRLVLLICYQNVAEQAQAKAL